MVQLKETLTVLNISVDRLGNARSILTDEAIGQLGRTVTDALTKLRDCSSNARQIAAHRTPGNKTVEVRQVRTLKKLTNRRDDVHLPRRERKVAESCKCCSPLIGLSVAIMLRGPKSWRFTVAELIPVHVQREAIHYTSFVSLIEIEGPPAIIEPEKSQALQRKGAEGRHQSDLEVRASISF